MNDPRSNPSTATPALEYIPKLSDYLKALDEIAEENKKSFRDKFVSEYSAVSMMYWLNNIIHTEPPSAEAFIDFVPEALGITYSGGSLLFVRSKVSRKASLQLYNLALLATDPDRTEYIDALIFDPTESEMLLLCQVAVEVRGFGRSRHQDWLLPPEPMCPVAVAQYEAFGGEIEMGFRDESELGFLGYLGMIFSIDLLTDPDSVSLFDPEFTPIALPPGN